jgi:hypothetical protein
VCRLDFGGAVKQSSGKYLRWFIQGSRVSFFFGILSGRIALSFILVPAFVEFALKVGLI